MTFEPVKIGVVGLGNFGRQHARTVVGLAESQLVALVARRQQSLDDVAGELSNVQGPNPGAGANPAGGWVDLDRAIDESNAEAWIVASSTSSHVSITQKLLAAGKTVLLEKPIADTLDEAEQLATLVRDEPTNLMLGHIVLFNSEYRELVKQVAAREPFIYLSAVRHRPDVASKLYPGESPFHMTMVHDLYSVLALVDRQNPTQFTAQVHHNADGACDLALAQLQWRDGRIATFCAGFIVPPGGSASGFDRMEVFGRGWAARLEPNPRPLRVWDDAARRPMGLEICDDPTAPTGMMAEQLRCFCRVVRGCQTVPVGATYADAMQVQRWIDRLEHVATQNA